MKQRLTLCTVLTIASGVILPVTGMIPEAYGEITFHSHPNDPPDASINFWAYPWGWTNMGQTFTVEDVQFHSDDGFWVYVYNDPGVLMLPIGGTADISFADEASGYVMQFGFYMEGFGSVQPIDIRVVELGGGTTTFRVRAETYVFDYSGFVSDQGIRRVEIDYVRDEGSVIAFDTFHRSEVIPIPLTAAYADAGGDYMLVAGEDLQLDGSGSFGTSDIVSWLWDFDGDGQYDDGVGESAIIPFAYWSGTLGWQVDGQYTVALEIHTLDGAVDQDSALVIPEPATLGMLALGGLAILRRRLVTTKPLGEDGKRRACK